MSSALTRLGHTFLSPNRLFSAFLHNIDRSIPRVSSPVYHRVRQTRSNIIIHSYCCIRSTAASRTWRDFVVVIPPSRYSSTTYLAVYPNVPRIVLKANYWPTLMKSRDLSDFCCFAFLPLNKLLYVKKLIWCPIYLRLNILKQSVHVFAPARVV